MTRSTSSTPVQGHVEDGWGKVTDVFQPLLPETGFRPERGIGTRNLIGFDDYRDFPNITRGLVARGWSDDDIKKVLGENFLRVFEKVCG